MTQEQINIMLVILPIAIPFIQFLLTKYLSKGKDKAEYGSELLEIANQATEALRKAREELNSLEDSHEKTLSAVREEHKAVVASIRSEYDARHQRLKSRVEELEKVQKIYAIQFDLVTHPNLEVRNISARAMDDLTASQKIRAIAAEQKSEKAE